MLVFHKKIRKKVVLALCGTDGELFDLRHFNNLPLQLMPRVLELIQEHSGPRTERRVNGAWVHASTEQLEKDALSRLFHTLRGWELPSLFENQCAQLICSTHWKEEEEECTRRQMSSIELSQTCF